MKDLEVIRRAIRRVDGDDVLTIAAKKQPHLAEVFLRSYFAHACRSQSARGDAYRKLDAQTAGGRAYGTTVDPDDTDHRSQRGANAAVRDPGEMPDVSTMDLRAVKAVAISIGSYHNRQALAHEVLARLRDLGAPQVADTFAKAWSWGDLDAASDEEAEQSGDAIAGGARGDELEAQRRLASLSRSQINVPSAAAKRRAKGQ